MAKEFQNVQAFWAFLNVLNDPTHMNTDLLSNLDPSGNTNFAIELAKIYTWYQACIQYDPVGGTFIINPAVIPDSFDNVVVGKFISESTTTSLTGDFYDNVDTTEEGYKDGNHFYEDEGHTTEITPNGHTLYIDKTTDPETYWIWNTTNSTYVAATPVDGEEGKLYIDSETNTLYRWNEEDQEFQVTGGEQYSFREGEYDGSFKYNINGGEWNHVYIHNVATLDANGKVKSELLPSYVDDVVEGYMLDGDIYGEANCVRGYKYNGNFYEDSGHTTQITPATDTVYVDLEVTPNTYWIWDADNSQYITATPLDGETGKIYIDLATNKTYRWGGSVYVPIYDNSGNYGTCSTAGAAKTVACDGYTLVEGSAITVRFTVNNTETTLNNITLNVNGTGAKTVKHRNGSFVEDIFKAGRTYTFVYDGTYYQLVGDFAPDTIILHCTT